MFSTADMILPNLYLGSLDATIESELKERGITHVVSVISSTYFVSPEGVRYAHFRPHLQRNSALKLPFLNISSSNSFFAFISSVTSYSASYLVNSDEQVDKMRIEVDDSPDQDLLTHFDETHKFISEAIANDGVVLVHCAAGVSRSASVVIAYIMKEMKLKYGPSKELVQRSRPVVEPNLGFEKQLMFYGDALGCQLIGDSPAHQELESLFYPDSKRIKASDFNAKWGTLLRFCAFKNR